MWSPRREHLWFWPPRNRPLLSQQQSQSHAKHWPAHRIYTCKDDQSLSPRRGHRSQARMPGKCDSQTSLCVGSGATATECPILSRWYRDCPIKWRLFWQTLYFPKQACSVQLARSHTGKYLHESKSTQRQQMARLGQAET